MGKSQETYSKKEKEKKRLKKRQEKEQRREDRKRNAEGSGNDLESMMAYVDEYGNITDTPPDPTKKKAVISADSIELGVPKREDAPSGVRKGRVDFFNTEKGFGFIKEIDSHEKHFVHVHDLLEEIKENDIVVFEIEPGLKGMNAVRVKKA